jgi:hypothetical protein
MNKVSKSTEKIIAFGFGVAFIATILVLAVKFPNPTAYQYTVFRTVLALAAGGAASMFPGFLQVEVNRWIRAGGALAVFVLVYFYTPATLAVDKLSSISQVAGPGSTQIGNNSGTIILSGGEEAAKANLPVDISGTWDENKAREMTLGKLKNDQEWEGNKNVEHVLLRSSDLLYKDHQSKILSYSSAADGGCHACIPYLSFFEFEKRSHGWKLINSDIAAFQKGSYGSFDASGLSLQVIADNVFGAFITDCDMHQGEGECSLEIYARIGDSFKSLLSMKISEEDGNSKEDKGWKSFITMLPVPTGLYNLLVERKGNRGAKDLKLIDPLLDTSTDPDANDSDLQVADSKGNIRPKDVYKFDGNAYVRSDVYQ